MKKYRTPLVVVDRTALHVSCPGLHCTATPAVHWQTHIVFVHVLLVLIFCVFQARCSFLYISISVVWPFRTSAYVLLTVLVNISVNLLAGCVTVQSSADLCHNINIYKVCIVAGVGETTLNCTCAGAFTIPLRKSQTMSHSMILQTVTD